MGSFGFVSGILGTKSVNRALTIRKSTKGRDAGLTLRLGTRARHFMTARSPCLTVYSEIKRLMDQHVNRAALGLLCSPRAGRLGSLGNSFPVGSSFDRRQSGSV